MTIHYKKTLDLFMENTEDLVLILDQDFFVLEINPIAKKLLGWKKKDLASKDVQTLFTDYQMEPFLQKDQASFPALSITTLHKNQQPFIIHWKTIAIEAPEPVEHLLIIGKISKSFDDPLQNLQLENVLNFAPSLFYWKDINSVYYGCNNEFARLAGLKSRHEVLGKTDHDLIWKEHADVYIETDKEVIQSGKAKLNCEEIVAITKNKILTAITNKVPLKNKEGEVIGLLGITTDITQQKEVERELSLAKEAAEAANRAKTEFIANMSHDIRTPLTGIVGISNILYEQQQNEVFKQYAKDINECGEQLLKMLNNILDVVFMDSVNDSEVLYETFDLHKCIADIIQLENPTVKMKNLQFINHFDPQIPRFLINDCTKINRILLNLVGNAIKFTAYGTITLEIKLLQQIQDQVRISFAVKDTGIGIHSSQFHKVFDRFFRASPSYKGLYNGHGLGLHIAQSYAKLLNSEIKFESKKGTGSTFYFELTSKIGKESDIQTHPAPNGSVTSDRISAEDDRSYGSAISVNSLADGSNLVFLLVEDNKIALKVLEAILTQAGYQYMTALNGQTALELAKTQAFHMIITDIGLPGISGKEFVKQLRAWEKTNQLPAVPIIGLTAHIEKSIRNHCLRSGMNDVLLKPLNKYALQIIIQDHIAPFAPNLDARAEQHQFFNLQVFPLLDIETALKNLGANKTLLVMMLKELLEHEIPTEKLAFIQSNRANDWGKIEKLAHKMKGGLVYLGLIRMQYACQYMESYYKSGHSKLLQPLFEQMMVVFAETLQAIQCWLETEQKGQFA